MCTIMLKSQADLLEYAIPGYCSKKIIAFLKETCFKCEVIFI